MKDDFTDFYESMFSSVTRAVSAYCGDPDVAHEATQEAFARAYARWPRVRDLEYPEGWVTTTALNLSRRQFRRRSTGRSYRTETVSSGPSSDRVDVLVALRSLPPRQQEAIVLHYLLGLPVSAVADAMRLSEGGVKSHLHKGRAALRDPLGIRYD